MAVNSPRLGLSHKKKAVTCCFRIHLPTISNYVSAHILSLTITPYTVIDVLVSSILYLHPTTSLSPYYSSHPFLWSHFHLPSSLPAVTISSLPCLHLCLNMWATLSIQVSAFIQVCLFASLIECPLCQASSQSHVPVVHFVSSSQSALSSLPSNSSHLSFLLCFHFPSVLSLSPSRLPSSVSYFLPRYFSVVGNIHSFCLARCVSSLCCCQLICFCSFIFLFMLLSLYSHIVFSVYFRHLLPPPPPISTSVALFPLLLLASFLCY